MEKESHHSHKITKGVTSVTEWLCHMSGNMRTMGGKVHSHDGSCIYSVENQMGTLLSSPCQLGLGVDLSCYS